jgi:cyclopropane fatty-acyl-phospholipid synthase-like methyltransferase
MHMTLDQRLVSERFPRSSNYPPDWVSASGGANALWLAEWLAAALDLRPGLRVLDLGCGRASSSIFLRREFGVQVWATSASWAAAGAVWSWRIRSRPCPRSTRKSLCSGAREQ